MPLTANDFLPLKAPERLRLAAEHFAGRLVFATSLGAEDQVITDLIARLELPIPIVTLDTGRLFPETYDLLAETEARYGLKIRTFSPDRAELEAFVNTHGINAFRESEDLRHACCAVRNPPRPGRQRPLDLRPASGPERDPHRRPRLGRRPRQRPAQALPAD